MAPDPGRSAQAEPGRLGVTGACHRETSQGGKQFTRAANGKHRAGAADGKRFTGWLTPGRYRGGPPGAAVICAEASRYAVPRRKAPLEPEGSTQ
jgi:hypothetical protein